METICLEVKHPILVVDDDRNMLSAIRRSFRDRPDVELITAESAFDAEEILKERNIHILISDQNMPGYTGTELVSYAREYHPNAYRVLMTGYADTSVLSASVNEGHIRKFYQKPVDTDAFVAEIMDLARRYERESAERAIFAALKQETAELAHENRRLVETVDDAERGSSEAKASLYALEEACSRMAMENDEENLFRDLLDSCRTISGADAGALYLVKQAPGSRCALTMERSVTFSRDIPFEQTIEPMDDRSIVGYVARTRRSVAVADAYDIPREMPFGFDRSSDLRTGYRTKSLAAIPVKDGTGAVVGVVRLANRKRGSRWWGLFPGIEPKLTGRGDFEELTEPFSADQICILEVAVAVAGLTLENIGLTRSLVAARFRRA